MGTIVSTVRVGEKPPEEVIKRAKKAVREARKAPPVYDPECPPSSPEALAEFAAMARELRKNRRNPAPVVAIRLAPDVLKKYKALQRGYTSVMADILTYAVNNPEFLSRAANGTSPLDKNKII
jgi:uncharacterized protein (DUF4415 family)